jgi:predicted nucleic acid-binding Zn ribbon protein
MTADKRSRRGSGAIGHSVSRRSDLQGVETAKASGPRSLADVLTQLKALRGHGQTQGARQLTELWRRVAGPEIGEKTKVIGLKNSTLQVGVANAALLGELTAFHHRRLLDALRSDSEGRRIKGLKFQLRSS